MGPKPHVAQRTLQQAKQHPHQILPQSVRCTNDIGVLRDEFRSCLVDIKSLKQHLHEKQVLINRNSDKLLQLQEADPDARKAALRNEVLRLAKQIDSTKSNINRLLAEIEWRNKETEACGGDAETSTTEKTGGNILRDFEMLRAVRKLLSAQKEKDYYAKKKMIFEESLTKGVEMQHQEINKKTQDYNIASKSVENLRKQRDENTDVISKLQEELVQAGVSPFELQKMYKTLGMPVIDAQEGSKTETHEHTPNKSKAPTVKRNVEDAIKRATRQYEAEMLSMRTVDKQPDAEIARLSDPASPFSVEQGRNRRSDRQEDVEEDADIAYSPDRRLRAIVFDPPLPLNRAETPPRQILPPSRGGVGGTQVVETPSAIDRAEPVETYVTYASQLSPARPSGLKTADIELKEQEIEKAVIEDEIRREVTKRIDTARSKKTNDGAEELYKEDFEVFSDDIDDVIMDKLNSTARLYNGPVPEPVERNPDDFDFFA